MTSTDLKNTQRGFKERNFNFYPVADKAEFRHIKIKMPPQLDCVYQNSKRFYVVHDESDGTSQTKYMPSITTLLSMQPKPFLETWKKRVGEDEAEKIKKKAANRGSGVHTTIERYVLNEQYFGREATVGQATLFNSIKEHLNKIDNVIGLEVPLYSLYLQLAGRCDCIADYDGVPSIIDFKTSKNPKKREWIDDYFIQATFYSIAFEEMTGYKVKQLVIIIANEDGSHNVFTANRNDWVKKLWNINREFKPQLQYVPE